MCRRSGVTVLPGPCVRTAALNEMKQMMGLETKMEMEMGMGMEMEMGLEMKMEMQHQRG